MNIRALFVTLLTSWKTSEAYEMYDPDTSMCCNGTVHQWKKGSRCCGAQSYHPDDHICCFGQLLDLPGKGLYGCCGNHTASQVFQYGHHDCCHGHVVELPDSSRYYGCCGQQIYYPDGEICCDGMVRSAAENETCCGEEVMDESTQMCCQTWTKINESIELSSAVHPLTSGELSGCCGLQPFNWSSQMCCAGEIHHRNGTQWCCDGRALYDASTNICCHGRVYEKPNGSNLECCWTAMALYDPETDFCCDMEVVSLSAVVGNRTSCCSTNHHSNRHRPYGLK